jgi:hypothetical protein
VPASVGGVRIDGDHAVTDWVAISGLATAGGTLVLAVATFGSVRSANRAARVAEDSLLASIRPLLMPSRPEDGEQKVGFHDAHWLRVPGGRGVVEVTDDAVYMAMSVRNAGNGIAVLHGWRLNQPDGAGYADRPELESFRRLTRDLYVPAGDVYFWQGALREPGDPDRSLVTTALDGDGRLVVDVLYGDQHGRQRVISRFLLARTGEGTFLASVGRQWNVDRPDPR